MKGFPWDTFLERVYREVNDSSIRSINLLCRLLDGRLETVSTFSTEKGINSLFKGVRIRPPRNEEGIELEGEIRVFPVTQELAPLAYFAGASEPGGKFCLNVR